MTKEWNFSALEPRLVLSSTRIHTHPHTHSMNSPPTCRRKVIVVGHVVVIGNQMCQNYCHRPTIVEKNIQNGLSCDEIEKMRRCDSLEKKIKILLSINQFMQLSSETIYSSSV